MHIFMQQCGLNANIFGPLMIILWRWQRVWTLMSIFLSQEFELMLASACDKWSFSHLAEMRSSLQQYIEFLGPESMLARANHRLYKEFTIKKHLAISKYRNLVSTEKLVCNTMFPSIRSTSKSNSLLLCPYLFVKDELGTCSKMVRFYWLYWLQKMDRKVVDQGVWMHVHTCIQIRTQVCVVVHVKLTHAYRYIWRQNHGVLTLVISPESKHRA